MSILAQQRALSSPIVATTASQRAPRPGLSKRQRRRRWEDVYWANVHVNAVQRRRRAWQRYEKSLDAVLEGYQAVVEAEKQLQRSLARKVGGCVLRFCRNHAVFKTYTCVCVCLLPLLAAHDSGPFCFLRHTAAIFANARSRARQVAEVACISDLGSSFIRLEAAAATSQSKSCKRECLSADNFPLCFDVECM